MADPRADRTVPRLMGVTEIQQALGVSRQWAYVLIGRKGFPDPVVDYLAMGKAWLASDVLEWIDTHRAQLAEEPETDR
ncbi:helix-turn-helix transcriptional regulator [Actinoplanes sp. URMC 104]|uniref:helix-turn-helix transcriptional regulator n=1 Tax=Actinoplanes sp. URMC 104 TaxID=3423409 RepID=UPI003F1C5363